MPDAPEPRRSAFSERREQWSRESAELRDSSRAPGTSVEATVNGYRRSRTRRAKLPAPALARSTYEALSRRHRSRVVGLSAALIVLPVLLVLALVVDPMVLTIGLLALLLPVGAFAVHQGVSASRLEEQRHVVLRGGLADAWRDWLSARDTLAGLSHASQSYAAVAANEVKMETLVLALGRADADSSHRDSESHAASRAWVFQNAAKAVALVAAEQELDALQRGQAATGELEFTPDGDDDALDQALEAARELRASVEEPRE